MKTAVQKRECRMCPVSGYKKIKYGVCPGIPGTPHPKPGKRGYAKYLRAKKTGGR